MRMAIFGALLASLAACAPPPASPGNTSQTSLATYPGGSIVTATRTGRLVRPGQCLLLRDGAGRSYLPVFKTGSSISGDMVTIAGAVDKQTVRIGERITVEGGGQAWSEVPASYQLSVFKNLCSVSPFFVINAK